MAFNSNILHYMYTIFNEKEFASRCSKGAENTFILLIFAETG